MGLLSELFNKDNKNTIKDIDNDLDDYQKELIKKGVYDSSNFEEEDLEEDDYYYEDEQ